MCSDIHFRGAHVQGVQKVLPQAATAAEEPSRRSLRGCGEWNCMTPKVKILIEQIARFRVGGIRDGVIAAKLNISQAGFSRIIALP